MQFAQESPPVLQRRVQTLAIRESLTQAMRDGSHAVRWAVLHPAPNPRANEGSGRDGSESFPRASAIVSMDVVGQWLHSHIAAPPHNTVCDESST